jgi:hypothetical protein
MRFSAKTNLNAIVDALLSAPDSEERANGENMRWEGRISGSRTDHFEKAVGSPDPGDFGMSHADYVGNYVNIRKGEPVCFAANNDLALVPELDPTERLVRVEDMTGWTDIVFGGDEAADMKDPRGLKAAFDAKSPQFKSFLQNWNDVADFRPMFAAVAEELDAMGDWRASWSSKLPELLGLGHLRASAAHPRALALMEYPAARVLDQSGDVPSEHRFAAPTVIDHHLNGFFCPSPAPAKGAAICYGRAVNLAAQGTLVCEVIHRHISYKLEDVKAIVVLTGSGPWATVSDMRATHLTALRRQPGWADFGMDATGS